MKLDIHLADSASVDDRSKAYALGLGWTHTSSPTPPIALLVFIELDQGEVPAELELQIQLVDKNERVARYPSPLPDVAGPPVVATGLLQAPALDSAYRGDPLRVPLVINFGPGIVLDAGLYSFRASLSQDGSDNTVEAIQVFRVRTTEESPMPRMSLSTELQGGTDRSQVEISATKLGFRIRRNIATGADTYERPNGQFVIVFDKSGRVVEAGSDVNSLVKADLESVLADLNTIAGIKSS